MKNKQSKKLSSQPMLWRQAVTDSDNRGWNLKNILYYYPKKIFFKYKDNPSILIDKLIVGSNLVLSLLIIEKYAKELQNNNEIKKIGIIIPNQPDYWSYEFVNNKIFWEKISKIKNRKINGIEDFIKEILFGINKENLEIFLIKEENLYIHYGQYDNYINGWVFHLFSRDNKKTLDTDDYTNLQYDIRKIINKRIIIELSKLDVFSSIIWKNKSETNYPIILTKEVILTSTPQGWLSSDSETNNNEVVFKNKLSKSSFGTAIKIKLDKQENKINAENEILSFYNPIKT